MKVSKLQEQKLIGGYFTWSNKSRKQDKKESKIDRTFSNQNWQSTWPQSHCQLYLGGSSDHLAMIISNRQILKKPDPFRFLNPWMDQEGYDKIMEETWNMQIEGSYSFILTRKLKVVKVATKEWLRSTISL